MSNQRIVIAVNKMILNESAITNVIHGGHENSEIFFKYNSKYVWSMLENKNQDSYSLFFYPKFESALDVSHYQDFSNIDMVSYTTKELGTTEARESFAELYNILQEKIYGISDVLDDIINN